MTGSTSSTQIPASPYNYPHDASLSSSTTALIVIDMQRDFLELGGYLTAQIPPSSVTQTLAHLRQTIRPVQRLIQTFRNAGYPIYYTREGHSTSLSTLSSRELFRSRNNPYGIGIGDRTSSLGLALVHGQPGHSIIPEITLLPHEEITDKPGRSAFAHTSFEHQLRIKGITNLVLCGVTTDVCVHSSMREANDRGFDCLMVEDACAAATEQLHEWAVESVKGEGGIFGCVGRCGDVVSVVDGSSLTI